MTFFVPPSKSCSWIRLSASVGSKNWNGLVRHDNARKSAKEMLALIIGNDACSITSDENVHYKPGEFSHLDGKLLYLSQSLGHTQ